MIARLKRPAGTACPSGRRYLRAAAACLASLTAWAANSDITTSIDQGTLSGMVTVDSAGQLTITPPQELEQPAVQLELADVHRVVFGRNLMVRSGDVMLINNDGEHPATTVENTIRLRAGLHHIVLPYWQGDAITESETEAVLDLRIFGPGLPGDGQIPATNMYCFRNQEVKVGPSLGIDEQGYRLPELELSAVGQTTNTLRLLHSIVRGTEVRSRLRYKYLVADEDDHGVWESMAVFSRMTMRRKGTTDGISPSYAGLNAHFGLLFQGFISIPQDGEYTFSLNSSDGSRLYLGQPEQFSANLPPTVEPAQWTATTVHQEALAGRLVELDQTHAVISIPVNETSDVEISVPLNELGQLWLADPRPELSGPVMRNDEAELEDTAYVRDRNAPDKVISLPGRVIGLDDAALHFEFRGEVRQIDRGRVIGLVLNNADRPRPEKLGYHQTLHLRTEQVLVGRLDQIDDTVVTFVRTDGQVLSVSRDDVYMIRNELGRVLDLTEMEPMAVEDIPFFDHVIPYRANQSLIGGPIVLYDLNEYERGLSVHAHSRLHYRTDGQFTRFRAKVGLLKPDGRLGNVCARVLGDGQVLWEQTDITQVSGVIEVDVDIAGVERMIIEIDFGQGQNVGDRAAWVDPQLIRDTPQ